MPASERSWLRPCRTHRRCCTSAKSLIGKFTRKRRERRLPAPGLVGVDDIQPQLRSGISPVQITLVTLVTKLWCNLVAIEQPSNYRLGTRGLLCWFHRAYLSLTTRCTAQRWLP